MTEVTPARAVRRRVVRSLAALLVAAATLAVGHVPGAGANTPESPDPRFLVDDQGRVVILHGTNVDGSSKSSEGHRVTKTAEQLSWIPSVFGWNSVRFLIFWDGIEPTEGVYNTDYLDYIGEQLDAFQALGLHVVIDMHQDLYSGVFGGDGAPEWAIDTDGLTFAGIDSGAPWWLAAADPAVQRAYRNFWDPSLGHPEYREHYRKAWMEVVRRYHDHPAVIGYDIMNEPVFANGDLAATLALQADAAAGNFHNTVLTEFTQQIVDDVRTVDSDNWLFFEPTSLVNAFPYPGDLLPVTDPRPGPPRLVYAPHLYEGQVHEGNAFDENGAYLTDWAKYREADRAEQNSAIWVGEFGGASSSVDEQVQYFTAVMQTADQMLMGWAQWDYGITESDHSWSPVHPDGTPTPAGRVLTRTYPDAIDGVPLDFTFDPATGVFVMTWTENPDIDAPTEIVTPDLVYPDGYVVRSSDGSGTWSYEPGQQRVLLRADPHAATHRVCIAPIDAECPDLAIATPAKPVPVLPTFTG